MLTPAFESGTANAATYRRARWIWLRALGGIFFSAFYSLYFQIHGLIGTDGILPAGAYLQAARRVLGAKAYWYAPTLLWLNASNHALTALVWIGMLASVLIIVNVFPRISIAVAEVCFLSFIGAAQDFASYQSDGMLLEAGLISIFFAGGEQPSRLSLFMLRFEWFRIYFESGVVKILSGEPQWRNLTAMDKYYENGPLPTWLGWYVQQWPHSFHAFSAGATLVIELLVAWLVFFPKPAKRVCFWIVTPLQIGIILTANYAFLNYLVLFLGVLLLDDDFLKVRSSKFEVRNPTPTSHFALRTSHFELPVLGLLFITAVASFMAPNFPTVQLLAPFRVANSYGLFAVMTRQRYEIEFQGTADGEHWVAYPFRYKPQDPRKRPGIYAPYQPRFEWNLWFASLDVWENNRFVTNTELRLLQNSPSVLRLFASNPFAAKPPVAVRSMQWQYWFTTREERRATGNWWKRELVGEYAPAMAR